MTILMIVELIVVLAALLLGARYGGLALGAVSGIGLAMLVFVFHLKPGNPPINVIFIIMAAVTCAGTLQASGGMDWMLQRAEKLLRRHPDRITLLAPLTTFILTILVGTGHIVYTLMPIICDIALKQGIRPERPCSVASIASQAGIVCSPISAALIAFSTIANDNGYQVSGIQVIMITLPACLCGILLAVTYSWHRGLDLDKDPIFQNKLKDPVKYDYIYGGSTTVLNKKITQKSKRAVGIFFAGLGFIMIISLTSMFGLNILPSFDQAQMVSDGLGQITLANGTTKTASELAKSGIVLAGLTKIASKPVPMDIVIQIVMIVACALMVLFCNVKPKAAICSNIWQSGMVAVIAIYGIAWMTDTYFEAYKPEVQSLLSQIITSQPWAIAVAFFTVSVFINSQAVVVATLLPLAYSMNIDSWVLIGVLPSVYGYFFIPNYPSDIATINFDRSGTTAIGKYLFNHSFMLPGLIYVFTATAAGYVIAYVFHTMGVI